MKGIGMAKTNFPRFHICVRCGIVLNGADICYHDNDCYCVECYSNVRHDVRVNDYTPCIMEYQNDPLSYPKYNDMK